MTPQDSKAIREAISSLFWLALLLLAAFLEFIKHG